MAEKRGARDMTCLINSTSVRLPLAGFINKVASKILRLGLLKCSLSSLASISNSSRRIVSINYPFFCLFLSRSGYSAQTRGSRLLKTVNRASPQPPERLYCRWMCCTSQSSPHPSLCSPSSLPTPSRCPVGEPLHNFKSGSFCRCRW